MHRTSGNNAICSENLEKALAESPETYGHIDLIAFGFPCQDISNANPKGQGLKGKRSSIFFECMRIVDIFKPAWILIENVPRLLSINEGRDMAIVLQTMAKSGYWWAYRLLDSQYFGLAQRRKRVFIVGSFGNTGASKILFEPQGSNWNDKKKQKMGERGLCISTRCGERQDPTAETFIASTIRVNRDGQGSPFNFGGENIIASTLGQSQNPDPNYGTHFVAQKIGTITSKSYGDKGWPLQNEWNTVVAQTIGSHQRGNSSFVWQDTYIAETDTNRERKITGISPKLDSCRGIVIGNAVSVPVAKWIAERIVKYENEK